MNSEQKRYRDRATRAMRELLKEKKLYGHIHDGGGKRYLVGMYFLLAGDIQKAAEAFDWFYAEFPDDVGEPIQHLYSALAAYRSGDFGTAEKRLKEAMVSNVYLLPHIIQEEIHTEGIWHSSNWRSEAYLDEVREFLEEPNQQERAWITAQFHTATFQELMNGYLATYRALNSEDNVERRGAILDEWHTLQRAHIQHSGA